MKSFSRTQKKGILSARVIQNNRLNSSIENFDEMIEKQLEDDFKVYQYLNQNPNDGHNTEDYISLFNTLLVKKFNKIKRKQLLKSTKAQFQTGEKSSDSRVWSKSQVKSQNPDNSYYSEEQYLRIKQQSELQQEIIQSKTQQQLEMKRVLIKQIAQNKKSLNLLKGDIGHMIARNQSISVLESKVNKVSLVSQNQLKRVSMALTKDKQQVQLRQQMQKRFHAKLRGVENMQTRNLKKIKMNFIESMKRRKQIFDNLSLIEKQCASIEQYSDKVKIKQQKNFKSMASFKLLNFMCSAIDSCKDLWQKFENKQIDSQQYAQQLQTIFKYENDMQKSIKIEEIDNSVDQINQQILESLQSKIICEYHRLDNQIFEKKKVYNQHLSKIEEFWVKIADQQKKQSQIITEFNIQDRNELSEEKFSIEKYFRIFSYLKINFNILYFFIGYLHKKFNNFPGRQIVNQLYTNQCYHVKIQQDQIRKGSQNFNQFVCLDAQNKLQTWFKILKHRIQVWMKIPEGVKKDIMRKLNKVHIACGVLTEIEADNGSQAKINDDQYSELQQYQDYNCKKSTNQINVTDQKSTKASKYTFHQSKHLNEQQTAKRIQILQKIDQSYYRMIKETIQMQKQNTMKNYQFQRTFKRNKYSSQDSLLEQKRFQATFSSLFKQDPDENSSKIKIRQESEKRKKTQVDENNFQKTAFSSLHANQTKSKLFNSSTLSLKKNSNYMDKHKKTRLRSKLRDVLCRV